MKKFAMIALSALTIVSAATAGSYAISSGSQENNSSTSSARRVSATDVQGEDMTSLITNPSFASNNSDGWSGSTPQFQSYGNAEFYNTSFNFYQTLTGLQNGVYRVNVKGFYRAGDQWDAAYYYHDEGATTNLNAYVYAHDSKVIRQTLIQSICTGETETSLGDGTKYNDFGYVPNNMQSANTYCNAGHYKENTVYFKVTDGTMTIGVKKYNTLDYDWTLFDDWSLSYLGEDVELPEGEEIEIKQLDEIVSSDIPVTVTNDANHPWDVEDNAAIIRGTNQSNYYAASWITLSYSSEKNTVLSFEWASYNYGNHEALQLYIDGVYRVNTYNSSYTSNPFYLEPGEHVIAFRDSVSYYNYSQNWSGVRNIQVKEADQLVIDVPVPGAMGDSILAKVENFSDVYNLKLTGKLNSDDIATLKNRLTSLYVLDLEGLDWTSIPNEQFRDKTILQRVKLPSNVTTIGNSAFYNCQNLRPVTFPATLQSIGEYAFYRTYNIGDVVLPEGLTSIGRYAFYESHLTSVTFPSTLNSITYDSFYNCDYLKDIIFNSQTSIGDVAFYDCDALVSVKFPETLQSIGSSAFSYCDKLKDIEFNEGLTSIGDDAFYDCDAIESVTLPSSLQTLNGYDAFRYCDNLKQITCNAIVPPYTNNGNITSYSGLDLYVPQLSVNVYKQTLGWDQFNIHGINVMPENIVIQSDYNLNWPDSLSFDYKPNVILTDRSNRQYGSLTVNGNSTLSAGLFSIKYDPNIARNNGYYDPWDNYTHNRFAFTSLVNNATVRADNVLLEYWMRANAWEFVTIPFDVKVSDIRLAFEGTPFVIRKYDGQKRADGQTGETWVTMTADSTLHAGEGYIWRSASTDNNRSYTGFYLDALQTVNKNNIFANDNIETPLAYYESEFAHNRSWNLIGNPYPCFYDIRAMQTSAPITVWDTYQSNYRAYSPEDDAYILNPGQAFFVQRPVDEESIIFLKEGRQTNLTVRDIDYNNGVRAAATKAQRSVFNVILSNGEQADRTRFVINASATTAYEQGRDASKFASLVAVPQLYTIEDGVQFSINERPFADGKVMLGMQIVEEGTYTLKLDTNVDNEVWLIDNLTGNEVMLSDTEEGYTFSSNAGTFDNRFMLRIGNGETTGISATLNDNGEMTNDKVYDLQGRRVNNVQKGVYIKDGRKVLR